MKLLSEAFDTVKRVYAYEKSVKADTATLQKIMAVFAIVMILIDVENIRLGKYIIGAATFFVAAVSLVAVWALDYFKNVYRVCRIAAVYVWVTLYVGSILNIIIFKFQFQLNRSGTDVLIQIGRASCRERV